MKECSKSIARRLKDSRYASRYFVGAGVDIGGKPDPLALYREFFPAITDLKTWDIEDGDAQFLQFVTKRCGFVGREEAGEVTGELDGFHVVLGAAAGCWNSFGPGNQVGGCGACGVLGPVFARQGAETACCRGHFLFAFEQGSERFEHGCRFIVHADACADGGASE